MAAASCQLLSFLAAAARARVDVLGVAAAGPTAEQVTHLVDVPHRECYIANSLSAEVTVAPQVDIHRVVDG